MNRSRLARWAVAGLAVLLAWTLGGCAAGENNWTGAANQGPERSQKILQSVPARQLKGLTLRTGPGEVVLTAAGGEMLGFEVEKRAAGADPAAVDRYLEGVRVEVTVTGETVQVATRLPEEVPAGVKPVGVRYLVRVPSGLRGSLDLETDRATVRLAGLAGEAKVKVRQADVEVRDFRGRLKVEVEHGLTFVQGLEGQLAVQSNGPVEVNEARLQGDSRIATTNSRLAVSLAEVGVGQYEFLTSNAPVRLALPYGAAVRLRVATTNGRVADELPLTWVDRNETDSDGVYRFEGWLNAGGAQVGIATTNADVTLVYR
jgi:hypothetical protein